MRGFTSTETRHSFPSLAIVVKRLFLESSCSARDEKIVFHDAAKNPKQYLHIQLHIILLKCKKLTLARRLGGGGQEEKIEAEQLAALSSTGCCLPVSETSLQACLCSLRNAKSGQVLIDPLN